MPPDRPSFDALRSAADRIQASAASDALSQYIPPKFTWPDLACGLARLEDEDNPRAVAALRACLEAEPSRIRASAVSEDGGGEGENEDDEENEENEADPDTKARRHIRRFVARMLTPQLDGAAFDDELTHGDDTSEQRAQVARRCRAAAEDGLAVLAQVGMSDKKPAGTPADEREAQVLYTVTALADTGQAWTPPAAAARAQKQLAERFPDSASDAKTQWIVDGILKQYLRPLFVASRPAGVTASGRKAEYASASGNGGGGGSSTANTESPRAKPWKYLDLRALSVVAWAVHEADGELIRTNWPLFTPVLLALVEDPDTDVRARGLGLLQAFVAGVPDGGRLLHATGLDRVLADAVFPTMLFLPRLTPEAESLQLLPPAFAVLRGLAGGAEAPADGQPLPSQGVRGAAADVLDRILRDGVYVGYQHAGEHIRIAEVLVREAGKTVQAMGIYAVKHLQHLIPLYAGIMADPFAMRYLPAVVAAAGALQATIGACWPRLAKTPWQEEVLKMLMLCWLNMEEETETPETKELRVQLMRAADMQLAVMRAAGVDVGASVGPLVARGPRLGGLFRLEEQ